MVFISLVSVRTALFAVSMIDAVKCEVLSLMLVFESYMYMVWTERLFIYLSFLICASYIVMVKKLW